MNLPANVDYRNPLNEREFLTRKTSLNSDTPESWLPMFDRFITTNGRLVTKSLSPRTPPVIKGNSECSSAG